MTSTETTSLRRFLFSYVWLKTKLHKWKETLAMVLNDSEDLIRRKREMIAEALKKAQQIKGKPAKNKEPNSTAT